MIADKSFIFYSLPKSRTTQRLTGGNIEKVWTGLNTFLANCTTVSINEPTSIQLTAYSAWKDDEHPELADKIIDDTRTVFGEPQTEPLSYHYPSGVPSTQTKNVWEFDKRDLSKVLDYLIAGQSWPKFTLGPVELIVSFNFNFIDPATKIELPNQQNKSSIIVWLSRSCSCSPDLYFPFDDADQNFKDYLNKIETHLPFKFEGKYLRLGRPNKNKTQYTFTKLKTE
ncbi:hypothetical protein GCM10022407_12530 [Hymenobacter antarcticus]|uniref:Uncharacterized protein n=2 Tax=Hymenobacter antarcticus TaxID=486270 RepID=A0ABP7PML4_9BACT